MPDVSYEMIYLRFRTLYTILSKKKSIFIKIRKMTIKNRKNKNFFLIIIIAEKFQILYDRRAREKQTVVADKFVIFTFDKDN